MMRRLDLLENPLFVTAKLRRKNFNKLMKEVNDWASTFRSIEDLEAQVGEVGLAVGKLNSMKDFAEGEWGSHWGAIRDIEDGEGGVIKIPGLPWKFSKTNCKPGSHKATRGMDNKSILKNLGYSDKEIKVFIIRSNSGRKILIMFDLNLKDKVVLITGGSDGLGFASAKLLSEQGAKVVICGRRIEYLKEKANIIREATNNEILDIQCDVTNPDQCKNLVQQTKKFNNIDVLVNNAGSSAAYSFEGVSDEDWEEDINLKLMAAIRMCRLVLPNMKSRSSGSIINASIGG